MSMPRNTIGAATVLVAGVLAASAMTTPAVAQRATTATPAISYPSFRLNFDQRTSNIFFGHGPAIGKDLTIDGKKKRFAGDKAGPKPAATGAGQ